MKKLVLSGFFGLMMTMTPSLSWGSEFIFGINTYSFDYREDLTLPLKSTETATVFAPFVYGKIPAAGLGGQSFVKVEFEITGTTKSDFDGSTQSGTPVKDTNQLSFIRGEADLYFEATENFFLYTGLGFRYWNRFLSGGAGYREIYTWGYIPFGLMYQVPITPDFSMGLDASYWMMVGGNIRVIFSETVTNGEDTDLALGNKGGYKLQLPMKLTLNPKYGVWLSPWYEASEIGASDVKFNSTMNSGIQEPASKTVQYGVATGVSILF